MKKELEELCHWKDYVYNHPMCGFYCLMYSKEEKNCEAYKPNWKKVVAIIEEDKK